MSKVKASPFPRTFWTANVMELFERGAYYGMNSVLAIYLTTSVAEGGLGASEQSVGFLQGIVYALTYVLPILGGALADRYGYRRMLLVAFSFLTAGYFAAGYMSSYALVFLALAVMATGAGLFKPIISGTIARSHRRDQLRLRVRHLLLDDQPGGVPGAAGGELAEGVLLAVRLHRLGPLHRPHAAAHHLRLP